MIFLRNILLGGTFIFPVNDSLRLTSNIFEFCQQNLSKWNSISISGYHIREAGSTAVQELAFTFANAITYLEKAKEDDLDLIKLTEQVSFFSMPIGTSLKKLRNLGLLGLFGLR